PMDAYRAISEMLASLGDPYTRLRHHEETSAVFLGRHGGSVALDPLGQVRPHSRPLIAEDLEGGLGYIRLSSLTDPGVVAELRRVLQVMRDKEGIVLDLRGNPGGFSRVADAIGDLLVGPGEDVGVDVGPDGAEAQVTGGDGAVTDRPIAVLVDGATASAAERLARALEATGRGFLVGEATRGKGLAQATLVLPGGMTVMVSAAEMLDRDGRPLQGRGLRPGAREADGWLDSIP
ncbi:MAG: S41 family peptidase, partial [Acidobacteriota bacterium]